LFCLTVRLFVGNERVMWKNGNDDRNTDWGGESKERRIAWGPVPATARGNFWRYGAVVLAIDLTV